MLSGKHSYYCCNSTNATTWFLLLSTWRLIWKIATWSDIRAEWLMIQGSVALRLWQASKPNNWSHHYGNHHLQFSSRCHSYLKNRPLHSIMSITKYSQVSIIRTVCIKRTVWNFFNMSLLNVPYDVMLKTSYCLILVLFTI